MSSELLRVGELAARAGVSTRTVDYYTGLGLLTPSARSGGNFRLYDPVDVQRIGIVRRLEAHGLRLEEIVRLLTGTEGDDHGGRPEDSAGQRAAAKWEIPDIVAVHLPRPAETRVTWISCRLEPPAAARPASPRDHLSLLIATAW